MISYLVEIVCKKFPLDWVFSPSSTKTPKTCQLAFAINFVFVFPFMLFSLDCVFSSKFFLVAYPSYFSSQKSFSLKNFFFLFFIIAKNALCENYKMKSRFQTSTFFNKVKYFPNFLGTVFHLLLLSSRRSTRILTIVTIVRLVL